MYSNDDQRPSPREPLDWIHGKAPDPHFDLATSFPSQMSMCAEQLPSCHLHPQSSQSSRRQPRNPMAEGGRWRYGEPLVSSADVGDLYQSPWRSSPSSASSARDRKWSSFQLSALASELPALSPIKIPPPPRSSIPQRIQEVPLCAPSSFISLASARSQDKLCLSAMTSLEARDSSTNEVEWQAASVATEMALQVLRSDDTSDESASSSLPTRQGLPELIERAVALAPRPSDGVVATPCDDGQLLTRSISSGDTFTTLDRSDAIASSYAEASLNSQHRLRPGDRSDTDNLKKRGKARMSQEKRRRLARRKEREAVIPSPLHKDGAPSYWSDVDQCSVRRSTSSGTVDQMDASKPLSRSATVKLRPTHGQAFYPSIGAITAVPAQSSSEIDGVLSSSPPYSCVGSDRTIHSRLQRVFVTAASTDLQTDRGTSNAGRPMVATSSQSSVQSQSSLVVERASAESGETSTLAPPNEALYKVENLRALEKLTTQMLMAKQRSSSPLPPLLSPPHGMTRSNWRPAYSYTPNLVPAAATENTKTEGGPLSRASDGHAVEKRVQLAYNCYSTDPQQEALTLLASVQTDSAVPFANDSTNSRREAGQKDRLNRLRDSCLASCRNNDRSSLLETSQVQTGWPGKEHPIPSNRKGRS